MKHLATLLTMAITFTGLAQQMPYNPDANGDDFVGVDDVLGVLGVYDTALMQPDLTCDYEGTNLEQFFGGLLSGGLLLDSVYVDYLLVDSVMAFNPECPEPVLEEVVLERSFMLTQIITGGQSVQFKQAYGNYLGYPRSVEFSYSFDNGNFQILLRDDEVSTITAFGSYSYASPTAFTLPFNDEWSLDENGIQISWHLEHFASNCEFIRVIPFWHEAE